MCYNYFAYAPVAQWIRVLPSEGKGRRFNSDRAHHTYKKGGIDNHTLMKIIFANGQRN